MRERGIFNSEIFFCVRGAEIISRPDVRAAQKKV